MTTSAVPPPTIVCLRCGVLSGSPSRCPSCGGEVWDAAGKDKGFVLDYLKLEAPTLHRTPSMIAIAVTAVVQVGAVIARPDLVVLQSPVLTALLALPAYFVAERIRVARLTPALRAMEALVPPSPLPRRVATGVPAILFLLCSVVFALELVRSLDLGRFAMRPDDIVHGRRIETVITSIFLHANLVHLMGNAYVLLLVGIPFDLRVGRSVSALVFVATGIVGSLAFAFWPGVGHTDVLGASGAIFGIVGANATSNPELAAADRARRWRAVGSIVVMIFGVGVLSWIDWMSRGQVAWQSHLGGLASGVAIGLALRRRLANGASPSRPAP